MAEIHSKFILDIGNAESDLNSLISTVERYKGNIGTVADLNRQTFKQSAAAVVDFNKQLANGTQIYQKVENSAKGFSGELKRLKAVYQDLQKDQKKFIAEGRYEELQKNIAGVKQRMKELGHETEGASKAGGFFSNVLGGIGAQMAGVFAIGSVVALGKSIFNTTAEFQKFDAVLTTSLGSGSAAERAMNMIQETAAKTPFSVQELTDSYVKLASRGIRATSEQIEKLGDLASSTGKSFDQLTEGILDSLSGENERMKEFGVTAQKTGETTQYTFKGVTTEVKNTKEAVLEYMLSLGAMEGVAGSSAAISQTLTGKVSNLGDAFDQLFLTLGNQQEGVFGGTISLFSRMTERATFLLATVDQLGEKMAAAGVSDFAGKVEADMKELARKTLAVGGDVETALKKQADALKADLEEKQKIAQKALDKYNSSVARGGDAVEDFLTGKYENKKKAALLTSQVADAKGRKAAVDDAVRYALEGEAALANALEAERAKKRKEAAEKWKKGEAKRKADALRAQKELEAQLLSLEKEAAKARLDLLDKNSKEYVDEIYKQRDKEIDAIAESLRAADKKAGGDGILGKEQEKQIRLLRTANYKDYFDSIAKIEDETNEKILSLQKDSDQKQIDQINLKYDKEIAAAVRAKNTVLAEALEKARQLELIETRLTQANKRLDTEEAIKIGVIETGAFDIGDSNSAVDIERKKQQAILDVQIEYAQKRLDLAMAENTDEGTIRALGLQKLLNDLNKQKDKLGKEDKFNLMDLLGVKEEDREDVKKAFGEVVSFVQDFTAQRLEAANALVEQRTEDVESAEEDLNTEIELNKLGFASNVETKRAELEEARKARAEALEDQKKAQRAQMAIETITQTVGLITSSVDILKGFSKIPIIGLPLGIAAVAAMFGAFVSMKSKAMQSTKMAKGGILGGRLHSEGGNKFIALDGSEELEHEKGEFFVNRQSTKKRIDWLHAINDDDENRLSELAWKHVLEGTGVAPSKKTAKKAAVASSAYQAAKDTAAGKISLKAVETELKAIKKNTAKDGLHYEDDSKKVYIFGNVTRTIRKK